jgi:hypothetical protein
MGNPPCQSVRVERLPRPKCYASAAFSHTGASPATPCRACVGVSRRRGCCLGGVTMNKIIYIIGLVVVIVAVLSWLGFR